MMLSRREELHGANKVPEIFASAIATQVLALLFLLGRIISRVYVIKNWGWDDTLIVFAVLNSLIMSSLFMVATQYGQGWHMANVPLDLLKTSFSITYVTLICYQLALALTKLSILVFYLRVFPARRERWLSWGTIAFIVVSSIPILICNILQCNPTNDHSFFGGDIVCLKPTPVLLSSTVVNIVADAWLIIMVIPVVVSLQIPPRQRLALMSILSLGVFVIIASCIRIAEVMEVDGEADITWLIADFDTWTVLEVAVGIVCACAPALRPLIQKVFPKLLGSVVASSRMNTRTAIERVENRRVGAIELGARKLRTGERGGDFAGNEEAGKKNSWLSDDLSEDRLILQQGKLMRRTESPGFERPYGQSGGYVKSPEVREGSDVISLEEGLNGMMRRPPK